MGILGTIGAGIFAGAFIGAFIGRVPLGRDWSTQSFQGHHARCDRVVLVVVNP